MAGILDALTNAIGKPGRKLYERQTTTPPFSGMDLKEKLQALVLEKRTADREQRIRRHMTWYLMALYYRGYQNVDLNSSGSSFDVFEKDDFYVENQFRKYVDTVKGLLNKMEGEVVARPASDSPQDLAKARVSDPILEMQRDFVGYDKLKDQKNLHKCLFGNAFIFTDYVTDKKYGSIVTPKFSYREVPDPTFDPMSDPSMMDGMGGDGVGMMPPAPPTMMSKVVTGMSSKPKGKQVATVCSPLEINTTVDVRPFTEVPFIQWISRQDTDLLNYLYPGAGIESGMSSVEQDLAQQYIDILSNTPGNVLGDSLSFNRTQGQRKKSELVRTWLQPCCFKGDKELENKFETGVHVVTINGRVMDYYEEDLTDRWTHEVLIPLDHALLGDGLYDMVLMQDQLNEIDSLLIQHMRYSTVGKNFYNSNVFDAGVVVNDPKNAWVPIKLGLEQTIQQCVMQMGPTQLSQDVGAWRGAIKESMQDMSSYDVNAGKSLGANAPYSQSVFLAEHSESRWRGSMAYNAPELIRFHEQLLEDARRPGVDLPQRAMIDNIGQWSFQQFQEADLQGEVDIRLSNTDFTPRSRAEKVQALTTLMQLAPILPLMSPKQRLSIEEILGLPPESNPMSEQIMRANRMIERLKKGEEISPLPLADNPQAQVPVFMEYLISEQGETLGETQPEVFASIFSYAMLLLNNGMMEATTPGGQVASQVTGRGGPPQPTNGGAPAPGESKPAGGQVGQKGGGPGAAEQPEAQSPAKPAPPVSPPSPT